MSTRICLYAVTSLDPLRDAIGCGDDALIQAVLNSRREEDDDEEDEDEDEDFREWASDLIKCSTPPSEEPGCWNYIFLDLAKHFQLSPQYLPMEDWKYYHIWDPYFAAVQGHISPESLASLKHLEQGRPFKGKKINHDGCAYAWLDLDESNELLSSLSKLDADSVDDGDGLDEFHHELIDSLKTVCKKDLCLFMTAS